jgi:hypothetical protein
VVVPFLPITQVSPVAAAPSCTVTTPPVVVAPGIVELSVHPVTATILVLIPVLAPVVVGNV